MPTILLLHGALGAASLLEPLAALLRERAAVHTLNFAGHSGLPLREDQFSMAFFARQVQEKTAAMGSPVNVFGYSMGGYAALLAAQTAPLQFAAITTLGTKFDWSPATAAEATRFLDPAKMEAKVPRFTEQLRQLHAPSPWQPIVTATARMMHELGNAPLLTLESLRRLTTPVQVLVGDSDQTAGAAASAAFAAAIPHGSFEMLPNTPHPMERVNLADLAERILRFGAQQNQV